MCKDNVEITWIDRGRERCGVYLVECKICGSSVALTTAGRIDDPRSVTIACKIEGDIQ